MGRYVMERASLYNKPMIASSQSTTTTKLKGLVKDLLRGVIYAEDFGVWQIDPAVAEERMNKFYQTPKVKSLPANHRIQERYPELVIEAISNVIKQATGPTLSSQGTPSTTKRNKRNFFCLRLAASLKTYSVGILNGRNHDWMLV